MVAAAPPPSDDDSKLVSSFSLEETLLLFDEEASPLLWLLKARPLNDDVGCKDEDSRTKKPLVESSKSISNAAI